MGSNRSPLEAGGDVRKDWRQVNAIDADLQRLQSTVATLTRRVDALSNIIALQSALHPFKLYLAPTRLITGAYGAADWRTFRVRAGRIILDDAEGIDVETGTDGAIDDPDGEGYGTDATHNIVVPENKLTYWVWLWIRWDAGTNAWKADVKHAEDPAAVVGGDWPDWPTMDGSHVPLACVDTQTELAGKRAIVRQFIRGDLVYGRLLGACENGVIVDYSFSALKKKAR